MPSIVNYPTFTWNFDDMSGNNVGVSVGLMVGHALHHHVLHSLHVGDVEGHHGHGGEAAVLLLVGGLRRLQMLDRRTDNP